MMRKRNPLNFPQLIGKVVEIISDRVIVKVNDSELALTIPENLSMKRGDRLLINQSLTTILQILDPQPSTPPGRLFLPEDHQITFQDIGGLKDIKEQISKEFLIFMQQPEKVAEYHLDLMQGILLEGPPGCGKTMLASAIAHEAKLPMLVVGTNEIVDSYIGDSSKNIAKIFSYCRSHAPIILFMDEIEALTPHRGHQRESGEIDRLLTQLLQELDGLATKQVNTKDPKPVFLLGATNRLQLVDLALRRPGRFDLTLHVPLPNDAARNEIFRRELKGVPKQADININEMVVGTAKMTGATIHEIIRRMKVEAISRYEPGLSTARFQITLEQYLAELREVKKKRPLLQAWNESPNEPSPSAPKELFQRHFAPYLSDVS
ncbi:MAG: ATP-binding protein [Promethearchaeota archaeon]